MRVLVTGASGQLGTEVVGILTACGDEVLAAGRIELDVADRSAVFEALAGSRVDAVVNCAACTDVDACESDPGGAKSVNALGVGYLAEACDEAGAHLVTVSTDYVFDGAKRTPYREGDSTNPLSVYGRTKLAGEEAAGRGATVVRTSLVCGRHGDNAVTAMLEQLRRGSVMRYVTDQVASPTFATDLAEVVVRLARGRWPGLFHVTNQGVMSRYELARAVSAEAGFDPDDRVMPITTAEIDPPRLAARPAYSVLDNAALRVHGIPEPRHFAEPLADLVAALLRR